MHGLILIGCSPVYGRPSSNPVPDGMNIYQIRVTSTGWAGRGVPLSLEPLGHRPPCWGYEGSEAFGLFWGSVSFDFRGPTPYRKGPTNPA